tara:strand:- start:2415 stop:3314 length:900 start_codon:yes stop_codon:yes gene_type:complete
VTLKKSPNTSAPMYGGQAVIEGVMIRARTCCTVAVRRPNGKIVRHVLPLHSWANGKLRLIPLVRGIVVLLETMIIGMKALAISSSESSGEELIDKPGKLSMAITLFIAFIFSIGIFFLLPLYLSEIFDNSFENELMSNIVEGVLRLILFIGYIWLIGQFKDIKRVFGYHGAEHMTVHLVEKKDTLSVNNVKKYPPEHARCGTSFLLTVVFISILFFIIVPREPFWFLIVSRIIFVPLIAGISYELIRFSGRYSTNFLVNLIGYPNLLLQKLTTRNPDDSMIEVAINAMEYAIELDNNSD